MPPIEDRLTKFIHEVTPEHVPQDVLHMARRCLVDTLAVWAGGISSEASQIARDHAAKRYFGQQPMPFDCRKVNPVGFAFAGAATIDALDGHDGHQLCKGHASAALVPVLFAELGTNPECSIEQMLTHLVVGHEVAIRAGLSLHNQASDYHSSGAWSAVGCAAISARLRSLTHYQTREALGIAEYYAPRAPMMRCIKHPTMVKDSSSWGALTGITSADLAEDGFTGAPAEICYSPDAAEYWHDLGQRWRILETNFKAYPVCRWAHPPVEAVLGLIRKYDIQPQEVTEVMVSTFNEATRLNSRRPTNSDAAQYSLPLAVALAMEHGTILPDHLSFENYDTPEIWRIVDMIAFSEVEKYNQIFPGERCADVTLVLRNGRRIRSEMTVARGNHDVPLSDAELLQKFQLYTSPIMTLSSRHKISNILATPQTPISPGELVDLIQSRPARVSIQRMYQFTGD